MLSGQIHSYIDGHSVCCVRLARHSTVSQVQHETGRDSRQMCLRHPWIHLLHVPRHLLPLHLLCCKCKIEDSVNNDILCQIVITEKFVKLDDYHLYRWH